MKISKNLYSFTRAFRSFLVIYIYTYIIVWKESLTTGVMHSYLIFYMASKIVYA